MARTLEEIQLEIISEKNTHVELNSLNSTSKTAIWRLWIYIISMAHFILETLFDRHKEEVNERLNVGRYGTAEWFAGLVREFQKDDTLTVIDNKITYSIIDAAKKIITRVAIIEASNSTLTIKVAKGDANDVTKATALTTTELQQLESYLEQTKPCGVALEVNSLNADRLILSGCTVYFNAIFNPAEIKANVEAKLLEYMQTLRFDGKVLKSEVVDYIQTVQGVNDITITNLYLRQGANDVEVVRSEYTLSGYLNEDDVDKFADNITYVPE